MNRKLTLDYGLRWDLQAEGHEIWNRNSMFGPGFKDVDASIGKDFPFVEGVAAHFQADVFNLTNTPAFTNPDTTMTDGAYGQITSVRAFANRQMQLSLRITF